MFEELIKEYGMHTRHIPAETEILNDAPSWREMYDWEWSQRAWNDHVKRRYGVWRWRGIMQHSVYLLDLIMNCRVKVDFGGHEAALGFGAFLVDIYAGIDPQTFYGAFKGKCDLLFSSHTLEHIPGSLNRILAAWAMNLSKDGHLFLHLPSYRSIHFQHANFPDHVRTFYINEDINQAEPEPLVSTGGRGAKNYGGGLLTDKNMKEFDNIEEAVGRHFEIIACKNVVDWCMVIHARKK